jgi:hypothetical protein
MLVTANRETCIRWTGPELHFSTREEGMTTHWKATNENLEVCVGRKGEEAEK